MNLKRISILFLILLTSYAVVFGQSTSRGRDRRRTRNYELVIRTNVNSSAISVKGGAEKTSSFAGTTNAVNLSARGNFDETLEPGTYTVIVTADGYYPETLEVQLNENKTLNINLRLMTASVTITIPRRFYAKNPNARGLVKFYDNGELLRGGPVYELTPGQHTLRIESGGLWIQGTFRFEPGKQYTLEPELSLNLK